MAKGWNIVTVRPNTGGGAMLQGRFLVAISDRDKAIGAVQARFPDAQVTVDSEASAESLAKYLVKEGEIFVLVEGS
jgi:hypothetical protein